MSVVIVRDAAALALHARKARTYRQQNPDKVRARLAVRRELAAGRMVRPGRCESCGVDCRPEASHGDYSKPLEVQWLCRPCHERRDLGERCKHGHEWTPGNTRWAAKPNGGRQRHCRACQRGWTAAYRARIAASKPATPKLCRKGLHEMTPGNVLQTRQRSTVINRCRQCWQSSQRAYRVRRAQGGDQHR